jgi:aconitate hydratase
MGAELGATSSVFPSDDTTRAYLADRGRGDGWIPLKADDDAQYDHIIEIDLSSLEALAAQPHSPDNIASIASIAGIPVNQVAIGSCTNSSIDDLAAVAEMMKGKTVHPNVSAGISPGSRATLLAADKAGVLVELIRAGFRILESACGPCIGMGFAPKSDSVSLRTFNRNFKGRSGTASAGVYLVSPETAAAAAITGVITDPRTIPFTKLDTRNFMLEGIKLAADDMFIAPLPLEEAKKVTIERGPNIKACPIPTAINDTVEIPVVFKAEDNITTDDIAPAGAKVLPLRSNIPEISKFVFAALDADFWKRAQELGSSIIVGGANYGQGSSREHAALAPMYLGIKVVLTKSFARIHKANLINYGILPLIFKNADDYDKINQGDILSTTNIHAFLSSGDETIEVVNKTKGESYKAILQAEKRDRAILQAGGLIPYTGAGK